MSSTWATRSRTPGASSSRSGCSSFVSPIGQTMVSPHWRARDAGNRIWRGYASGCLQSAQASVLFWRSTWGRPRPFVLSLDSAFTFCKAVRMAHCRRESDSLFARTPQALDSLVLQSWLPLPSRCACPRFRHATGTSTNARLDSGVPDTPRVTPDALADGGHAGRPCQGSRTPSQTAIQDVLAAVAAGWAGSRPGRPARHTRRHQPCRRPAKAAGCRRR